MSITWRFSTVFDNAMHRYLLIFRVPSPESLDGNLNTRKETMFPSFDFNIFTSENNRGQYQIVNEIQILNIACIDTIFILFQ